MAGQLIPEETWQQIRALLPAAEPDPSGGRPPVGDREVLTGVLFVLRTGIAWQDLPAEMGCGCGMTCLRRIRKWQQDGIWEQIRGLLQPALRDPERFDWSRIFVSRRPRQRRAAAAGPPSHYPRLAGALPIPETPAPRVEVREGTGG